MPNRIDICFARLRTEKSKGFIPYICAGDPSFAKTVALAYALEEAGADLLEVGLPFSDPLADGMVNQLAAQRALAAGATVCGVFDCIREIRRRSQIPIVLYTYMNPIFQFGFDKFQRQAATAGVDGLLILDLPPEEDTTQLDRFKRSGWKTRPSDLPLDEAGTPEPDRLKRSSLSAELDEQQRRGEAGASNPVHIRLIAPTTPPERSAKIAATAKGFLYYVSREGVTGARETIASSLGEKVAQLRRVSNLPIAVGFGISNADQAREVAQHADAVVVGSAIVDRIAEFGDSPDLIQHVIETVEPLVAAIKSV